ncbi:hypothetical protein, partial [Ralstonia pseudosolanacearum]|uniref:hypothetical protein n=1 Tax=Ralstonia pseudosolanacearum TaxID=1310165 RepID=UPI001FFB66CE
AAVRMDCDSRFHSSESGPFMQSYFWDGTLGQERPNRRKASVDAKISLGSKPGVRLFALPLPYAAP